jgi:hypothetical protein
MKRSDLVNIAIALVLLGWLLISWSFLFMVSNPVDRASVSEKIEAQNMMIILCVGIFCLVTSVWLSGFPAAQCRSRAAFVYAAVALPILGSILWSLER